mmetsp:Transcript_98511/g.195406  ORF Transcript_98511/g.195406 Transcript_98511/m.195406 type:complete len:242 (+) Transcript_98511:63-788(+)
MFCSASGCSSVCNPSNPATDSVRIDPSAFAREAAPQNRESDLAEVREAEAQQNHTGQTMQELAEQQRREEEEEVERAKMEEQRIKEERRLEAEKREEEERLRRHREEQERRIQEEKQKQERELERIREAKRVEETEARARKEALNNFYKQYRFTDVNEPARQAGCHVWSKPTTYPLHRAAELDEAGIVQMLLKEGANPRLKDSSGKTALQVARKKSKNGSHNDVLRLLNDLDEALPNVGGA